MNAEAVGEHAEARREEGLGQGYRHSTAVAEGREHLLGFGLGPGRDGERETVELGLALTAAIGSSTLVSPIWNCACMTLFSAPGLIMALSGLSLKRISMPTSAPIAFL
jgi:hypothetical protein